MPGGGRTWSELRHPESRGFFAARGHPRTAPPICHPQLWLSPKAGGRTLWGSPPASPKLCPSQPQRCSHIPLRQGPALALPCWAGGAMGVRGVPATTQGWDLFVFLLSIFFFQQLPGEAHPPPTTGTGGTARHSMARLCFPGTARAGAGRAAAACWAPARLRTATARASNGSPGLATRSGPPATGARWGSMAPLQPPPAARGPVPAPAAGGSTQPGPGGPCAGGG